MPRPAEAPRGCGEGRQPSPPARLPPRLLVPCPWGHGAGQRVAHKDGARLSSPRPWGQGPLCTAWMAWGQQLQPSPSSTVPPAASSFPGTQARGCIPANPPARQRASPPLPWPGAPLRWAGEGSFLPSLGMPGGRDGATGAGGRRTSRQRQARGSVPAHSAPAPVSCHNRGCSCHCLVCGLVPAYTMSLGTALAVCPT